jgi:integrase
MGRKRTLHHDLPPGLHRKRGRYYFGRKMEALGPDLTIALREWARRKGEEVTEIATFSDAVRHYRLHALHKVARSTQAQYERQLTLLETVFGRTSCDRISPSHVQQYLAKRPPIAGTREKAVLSLVFNHARAFGLIHCTNPCQGIRGTKSKSSVYITDAQLVCVLEKADPELAAFLELCWRTGADASVVLQLPRGAFEGDTCTITRTKTGEHTRIGCTPRLRELGQILPFRSKLQVIRKRFWQARKAAGQQWTIKQLRAKAGTDSASLSDANALLGHASESTTALYRRKVGGRAAQPIERPLDAGTPRASAVPTPSA